MTRLHTFISTLLVFSSATLVFAAQPAMDATLENGFARNIHALESMARVETQILESMPTLGASLLSPNLKSALWTKRLSLDALASAVADITPEKVQKFAHKSVARNEQATLRLDPARGYARYISRQRAYQHGITPPVGIGKARALDLAMDASAELELPLDEEAGNVYVEEVHMSANAKGSQEAPRTYVRETQVIVKRTVNGIPVVGSELRASVGNDGQIARLKVRWPEFSISRTVGVLRAESDVVREAVVRVVAQEEHVDEVLTRVVYVPGDHGFIPALELSVTSTQGHTPFQSYVPLAH